MPDEFTTVQPIKAHLVRPGYEVIVNAMFLGRKEPYFVTFDFIMLYRGYRYTCSSSMYTDLRSGPRLPYRWLDDNRYWFIWLIHDIMGSCKGVFPLRVVNAVLYDLVSIYIGRISAILTYLAVTLTQSLWFDATLSGVCKKERLAEKTA